MKSYWRGSSAAGNCHFHKRLLSSPQCNFLSLKCYCADVVVRLNNIYFNINNCAGISLPLQPSFSLCNLAMSKRNALLFCVHSSTTPALHYVSFNIIIVIIWNIIYAHHNHYRLVISSPQHQHFSRSWSLLHTDVQPSQLDKWVCFLMSNLFVCETESPHFVSLLRMAGVMHCVWASLSTYAYCTLK